MSGSLPTPKSLIESILYFMKQRGYAREVEILSCAVGELEFVEHDNWNGGIDYYQLVLAVPLALFTSYAEQLEDIENKISEAIATLFRNASSEIISGARIQADLNTLHTMAQLVPSESDAQRIWGPGFRLFISHVSQHRIEVSQIKKKLKILGVSAFVAHADIEPASEWIKEIDLALHSMQALAAILTPEFKISDWTDQEVGFAVCHGVSVLPVTVGLQPYGFIARTQGIPSRFDTPARTAYSIVRALLRNVKTTTSMKESLIDALAIAPSEDAAHIMVDLLGKGVALTASDAVKLRAILDKVSFASSQSVRSEIEQLLHLIPHG